ncbi:MAG: histidine phosphatase family protein [Alphaproteobacteria bacterium]|jgi:broad specificity phosphatase PhoE|nr:histidine phosphatase family protein [Alphaproteobacteria bacterium]|tara:strand:+ start:824 stop:1462 length:639 start_codon:yes stop_codon:yes gene_type:complete
MTGGAQNPSTRWWWVRHAPVTSNRGRLYGASDPPADIDDGEAFAGLAAFLPSDAVLVCSHLQRTHQTAAAIAAGGLALPTKLVEPDFGEQNFGDWQGTPYDQIDRLAAPRLHRFWFTTPDHAPPGGESFAELSVRVAAAIDRLTRAHAGRDIIAVAHGGPIRAALAHALGLDFDGAFAFVTDNLSVTRIDHVPGPGRGREWQVLFANVVPRW